MSTLKVDAIRHNSATSDAITTHSDGTASAKIIDVGGAQLSHRNVIINGDAKISQRATAQGSITSGGYYAVDRWYVTMDTAGTWTMYQDADVPSGYGFSKSVSLDVNTANTSLSAGSRAMLSYRLEGKDVQRFCKGTANAKKYAVSFWVKCGKTGTYVLELYDHDNSRHICKTYTISSANTWEQKKLIFDNETSNAFGNDNGKSFELQFYLAAGSNFTSGTLATSWAAASNGNRAVGQVNVADSTSNKYFLTGVQLEVGDTVTSFEHKSEQEELLRCYRYYYKMGKLDYKGTHMSASETYGIGMSDNDNTNIYCQIDFPVPMRVPPTTLDQAGASSYYVRRDTTQTCTGNPSLTNGSEFSFRVNFPKSGHGWGTGQMLWCMSAGSSSYLGFSAEL
tara:strand:+ start:663 stop:1847 length:1185 start_codon:yes stop_codon:yes gene_type:complete